MILGNFGSVGSTISENGHFDGDRCEKNPFGNFEQFFSGNTTYRITGYLDQKDLQKSQQFRQVYLEDLVLHFELILILLQPAMK